MKKILVVGSKGTLGQALVREFSDHHYDVIAWDREELDITDEKHVHEKIAELAPRAVINAAALNAVDEIETDDAVFEKAKQVNGYGPGYLAGVCKELDIPFVHYSSDYVFDGVDDTPYVEVDKTNPLSRYAETKLLGEQEVQDKGGKFFITRIAWLFGKPGISNASKRSFVDTMLWLVKEKGKEKVDVVSDQTGSPSYAPDVAEYTRKLIEGDYGYGIYHGANAGHCTRFEFAKEIFDSAGLSPEMHPVPATHFPRPASVPAYGALENTRGPEMRSWKEALREYLS